MSFARFMTLKSFRKFHPDWKINLILDQNEKFKTWKSVERQDEMAGVNYIDNLDELNITTYNMNNLEDLGWFVSPNFEHLDKSYVHTKDTLNWWLLYSEGGVVADMDILFIKSIDGLIDRLNDKNIDVALFEFDGFPKPGYMPVSFMVASPSQPMIKQCFDNAVSNYDPEKYESCGSPCFPPASLKEMIIKYPETKFGKLKSPIIFPTCSFEYSEGLQKLFVEDIYSQFPQETCGIHWYGGSQLSSAWSKTIDEYNYKEYKNTMTTAINKILEQNNE